MRIETIVALAACTITAVTGVYVANAAARLEVALAHSASEPGVGGREYALRLSLDEPTQALCVNLRRSYANGCANGCAK